MLLKKRLKAGILLYALFMASIFALLLQFYVSRVEARSQIQVVQYQQAEAFLMAELTKTLADDEQGTYAFTKGSTTYAHHEDHLHVRVQLHSGPHYSYHFYKKALIADAEEPLSRVMDPKTP